jgi:acetylglutamate kinase
LRELLEASFGRSIEPAFFGRPIRNAYVEESYRGAALVADGPRAGYLSKFAVTREAQGEGIGQDLWGALIADYTALVWRARRANPIRAWYERNCQGRFEAGEFTVYFRGLAADDVPEAIHFALAQPIDL